jgi:hypothetical protein
MANLMSKRYSHKWGSENLKCAHEKIIQKNGIVYCTKCGKNFYSGDLQDEEYYNLFEDAGEEI